MATRIYSLNRLSLIVIILIYCLASSFCKQQQQQPSVSCASDVDCNNGDERILSRKRRALKFPEGSSLQLVYDQTIPIVAAQLLFTVGVTCALAFELPHKPIYQITQELRENLQKRLHPELRTTEAPKTNSTEMDDHGSGDNDDDHHSRIDYNNQHLKYIDSKQNYFNALNKHNYYYHDKYYQSKYHISDKADNYATNGVYNSHKQANQSSIYVTASPVDGNNENVWKKVIRKFTNKDGKKVITMKIKKKKGKKKLGNIFLRKHHRVYPVFGKRSVDDHLSAEEILYMHHHRNSRFDLYEKVEGFLKGRGKDGTACVLKALCETAQRNQSEEKAPFLIEILRAVFSLPHQVLPYEKDSHQRYEDAHSNLTADCAMMYPQCKDSIWSPDFRF